MSMYHARLMMRVTRKCSRLDTCAMVGNTSAELSMFPTAETSSSCWPLNVQGCLDTEIRIFFSIRTGHFTKLLPRKLRRMISSSKSSFHILTARDKLLLLLRRVCSDNLVVG